MVSLLYVNTNPDTTIFYKELEKWKSEFSSRLCIIHYWSDEMKTIKKKKGLFPGLFKGNDTHAHRINPARMKDIFTDKIPLRKQVPEDYSGTRYRLI